MGARDLGLSAYWALERRIAPGLRYSQASYEDAIREEVHAGAAWLDVGCGHQVLPEWRREQERALVGRAGRAVGVDPHLPSLRGHATFTSLVCATISELPFEDGSFDLVTANMVVEHLDDPARQFAEVRRVLRPGGTFLFHTPNARSHPIRLAGLVPERLKPRLARLLEGRAEEDVFPTHYRANTVGELRALAERTGLEVAAIDPTASTAVFAPLLPVAVAELLWIRLLMTERLRDLRQTLIVRLRRPAGDAASAPAA